MSHDQFVFQVKMAHYVCEEEEEEETDDFSEVIQYKKSDFL